MTALTEEQAKAKWCHRAPTGTLGHRDSYCMGSACMAWRLAPQEYDEFYTLDGIRKEPGYPYSFEEAGRMRRQEVPLPRKGFCGLAGEP